MQQATPESASREKLAVILAAAVVQGWALFGLHHAIAEHAWPFTHPAWLFALYAVVVLIPVTLELLAVRARDRDTWAVVTALTLVLFGFGWHQGAAVAGPVNQDLLEASGCFGFGLVVTAWWFLAMPFIQARLEARRWTTDYRYMFAYSWRNAVSLFEAAVFTAIFWLLLELWQTLFHMLGMDFFHELFAEPVFVYPVTALVFGCALQLIGSIERFVSIVLEQILSVLKWLGTVTGALLALFTLALVLQLPSLVFTGHKAISAAWLLWLVAVVVLFLNAAYRDGTDARAYPAWIAFALRLVVPLTTVISLTALYALYVRTHRYGLTVERVFAFVVAVAALVYALGYSAAACSRRAWFGGVAGVNVSVALGLIVVLGLTLTPILSPYRLAASSQYRRVLAGELDEPGNSPRGASALRYLRFDSGAYGQARLRQLAQLQGYPDAERIRKMADAAIRETSPWQSVEGPISPELVSALKLYPAGSALDAGLAERLRTDLSTPEGRGYCGVAAARQLTGLLVDLNGDGIDEFVLFNLCIPRVYQRVDGHWRAVAQAFERDGVDTSPIDSALESGRVTTSDPAWKDLLIGTHRFRVQSIRVPAVDGAAVAGSGRK